MVDPDPPEDWARHAPEFLATKDEADAEIARGERGVPLEVVLADLVDNGGD